MGRLDRPLNSDAVAAADRRLYALHENDPRPNALFDAQGNRKSIDPADPAQAGLRQEWKDLYSEALEDAPRQEKRSASDKPKTKSKPDPPVKDRPVGDIVEKCPLQDHSIRVDLVELTDLQPRPVWWWPKDPGGFPYPYEPYSAEITDGHKDSSLDVGGSTRYDCIPAGSCSIQFKQFLQTVQQTLQPGQPGPQTVPSKPASCPKAAKFKEFTQQDYGWDSKTGGGPWKSVAKGETDKARVEIRLDGGTVSLTQFTSADASKVTVSPATASAVKEIVTVTGVEKGPSEIQAVCQGRKLGRMKVKTYIKRTRTVAVRLVHGLGWAAKSTDVPDAAIRQTLRKVYKQAVVDFNLSRLQEMTVNFDLNQDGMIDTQTWMSAEMKVVRDACKDDSYDFNIFLVDNGTWPGGTGFMDLNQRYGFIHAGSSPNPLQTIAHELGHGQGLEHTKKEADVTNLMDETSEAKAGEFKKYRLRKPQWDKLNK